MSKNVTSAGLDAHAPRGRPERPDPGERSPETPTTVYSSALCLCALVSPLAARVRFALSGEFEYRIEVET